MTNPEAQDEQTWIGHSPDESVAPPAPANVWTPHDGGLEPAPPAPTSVRRAVTRVVDFVLRRPAATRER